MKEQLKAVMKAKTLREELELLPWSFIEVMAAIPIAMFIISVLIDTIMMIVIAYPYLFLLNDMWISFYILGGLSVLLYIGKCHVEKIKFRDVIKQNIPMTFLIGMAVLILISTMINGWTEYAIYGHPSRYESIFVYFSYFISFFFCSSIIKNEKIKKYLMYLFLAISLIYGICVGVSLISGSYTFAQQRPYDVFWIVGILNNPNHYAYYLTVAITCCGAFFALEKNKIVKWLCFVTFVINLVILIKNDTFGCYLSTIGGLVFLLVVLAIVNKRIDKNALFLIAVFIAVSFIINLFEPSVSGNISSLNSDINSVIQDTDNAKYAGTNRWLLWSKTIEYIIEKPFFGHGTEAISERLLTVHTHDRTHNEYLQYTAFYGIPAGICYLAAIMSVFIHGLKNKKKLSKYEIAALAAAFAYCFSAFFGSSRTYTAPYLFIFLGLGFGICNKQQAEKE